MLTMLAAVAALTFATPQASPDPARKPADRDTVVLRGCVRGGVFTPLETDEEEGSSRLPLAPQYRLSGPKELLKTLKAAHDGHYEEVTGRIRGQQPPAGTVRRGSLGKLGIVVGGPTGTPSPGQGVPEMPALQVESHQHLAEGCGN